MRRGPRVSLYALVSSKIFALRDRALDVTDMQNWGHHHMALWGKNKGELGDAPVQQEYIEKMRALARGVDHHFNGSGPKRVGFILMVFPFSDNPNEGRCNYMSNADRADVVHMLREQIKRFETQEAEENDVLFRR